MCSWAQHNIVERACAFKWNFKRTPNTSNYKKDVILWQEI